jgi:hypothetical protein
MDSHDDRPSIDRGRLARWTAAPTPRNRCGREPLLTPHAVIVSHGGETAFWLAWLRGDLDADLQVWFRRHADNDAQLRQDLQSIEPAHGSSCSTRAACDEVRDVLEAATYLTTAEGAGAAHLAGVLAFHQDEGQTATDLLRKKPGDDRKSAAAQKANQEELHRRIRLGLFALLKEVEIRIAARDEAAAGTWLLEHLVGRVAINRFLQLQELQERPIGPHPSLRERLLRALAPELFARDGERFRSHLSFRLFLRSRLQHACRRRGWLPSGPRYRDLPTAFAALSRERIGALVRGIATAREVFQPAGVPCQQLAALLEAAP